MANSAYMLVPANARPRLFVRILNSNVLLHGHGERMAPFEGHSARDLAAGIDQK